MLGADQFIRLLMLNILMLVVTIICCKLTDDHFFVVASVNCFWISLYLFSSCKETDGTRLFNAFWKSVFVTSISLSSIESAWPKKKRHDLRQNDFLQITSYKKEASCFELIFLALEKKNWKTLA